MEKPEIDIFETLRGPYTNLDEQLAKVKELAANANPKEFVKGRLRFCLFLTTLDGAIHPYEYFQSPEEIRRISYSHGVSPRGNEDSHSVMLSILSEGFNGQMGGLGNSYIVPTASYNAELANRYAKPTSKNELQGDRYGLSLWSSVNTSDYTQPTEPLLFPVHLYEHVLFTPPNDIELIVIIDQSVPEEEAAARKEYYMSLKDTYHIHSVSFVKGKILNSRTKPS